MKELILKGIMMSNHSEDDSLPRLMKRIVSLTKDVKRWNEAWYDQRDATGKACWDQYYYGVASARRGNIYMNPLLLLTNSL